MDNQLEGFAHFLFKQLNLHVPSSVFVNIKIYCVFISTTEMDIYPSLVFAPDHNLKLVIGTA